MSSRTRIAAVAVVLAFVVAGVSCAVLVAGILGPVLAFVLIAAGLVLATSLAFLEVGLSEDRERARERERQRRELEARGTERRRGRRPSRLARLRGERRHLR